MAIEVGCGRLGRNTASDCALRVAVAIQAVGVTRAVALSPQGHVTIESVTAVLDEDLVGTYTPGVDRRRELWRQIHGDLEATAEERGITGGTNQRISRS